MFDQQALVSKHAKFEQDSPDFGGGKKKVDPNANGDWPKVCRVHGGLLQRYIYVYVTSICLLVTVSQHTCFTVFQICTGNVSSEREAWYNWIPDNTWKLHSMLE